MLFRRLRRAIAAIPIAIAVCCVSSTVSTSQRAATAPPELVIQTGHSSRVNAAVFGPKHNWLATGSADKSIRLWDVNTGLELRALHGHKNWITSLAVNLNGDLLASGSNDGSIKVWNVSSGRELFPLPGHEGLVNALLFSPDDRWIISGGADKTIRIWDRSSGQLVKTLDAQTAVITALAIDRDGKMLASGSADNTIKLWDTTTWSPLRTLNKQIAKITSLDFSRDGRELVSASVDGSLIVWNTTNGRDRLTMKRSATTVVNAVFSGADELLSIDTHGTIVYWDAATGKEKRVVDGDSQGAALMFASVSDDRTLIASSSGNTVVQVSGVSDAKSVRKLASHSAGFSSVAVSNDGKWLAAGANDRTVRLWQLATGLEMPRLSGHRGWVNAVAFSPDSRLLASGSNGGEVKVWDVNSGRQVYTEAHDQETIHVLAFSVDGKWLASAGTGQTIHLVELSTKRTKDLSGHTGEITGLGFIPNSSSIASGSTDKTVKLWDIDSGKAVKSFGELSDQINTIAVNQDGSLLAAGTAGKKVELFKLPSGEQLTLPGHKGEVYSLSFSRDGRLLASGGSDQIVMLWDAKTGMALRTLNGQSGAVNGIGFSNDSQFLISGNGDGSVIVWNAESGAQAATLVSVPDGDDWLVATPDGLFDGTSTAWRQLLWRFSPNLFDVASVETFFGDYYYPGLLADVFRGKKPKAPADISQKDRRQPVIKVIAAAPQTNAASARDVKLALNVNEVAADNDHKTGSGAQDVRLFRNGSLVQVWRGDVLKGQRSVTLEATLPIVAGENKFTAYTFNHDNIKSSDAELVVTGSDSLKRAGTLFVLAVGVGENVNPDFKLDYAEKDVQAFTEETKRQQETINRYAKTEVKLLLNHQATKQNFLIELKRLAALVQPEDGLVIYFSGHGTAAGNKSFYMLPYDIGYMGPRTNEAIQKGNNLATILSHSISDEDLEPVLRAADAGQIVMVIDACHSGQALNADDPRRGPMNSTGLAQLAYEKGMYILAASQDAEVAFESAALGHSYLTYALVEEGLKTKIAEADANTDGQIDLREWFDYAAREVPQLRAAKVAQSTPQIAPEKNSPPSVRAKELEEVEVTEQNKVQTPRVFYRREPDVHPLIVAKH